MHPDFKAFSTEIPIHDEAKMAKFQTAMDSLYDSTNQYIHKLAQDLGITEKCATDVWYLRTRSRWTEELETELIRLHRAGTPPNIFDWP